MKWGHGGQTGRTHLKRRREVRLGWLGGNRGERFAHKAQQRPLSKGEREEKKLAQGEVNGRSGIYLSGEGAAVKWGRTRRGSKRGEGEKVKYKNQQISQ